MQAEILAVGDEITSGQLLDTNSQWLSLRLEEMGIRVLFHSTVGDEMDALAGAFEQAIRRADVVLVTGGLGPTADDLTRDALARAAGRGLVMDPAALEHVRGLFARRNRPMPPQNERQAESPEGSRVVPNPHGTAPGIDLDVPREGRAPCRVIVLPGVPAEMKEMWHGTVAGLLRSLGAGGRTIRHRRIKCFGAGESQIEAMLPDLIRRGRVPRVGINASQTTIILRITAEGANEEECRAAIEPTAATIYRLLGTLVYGEEDDELQDAVVRLLRKKGRTLATAEWGTAGTVARWLGSAAGSSAVVLASLVLSSDVAARRALDPPGLPDGHSPERGEYAAAMAEACRQRFGADLGLAVGPFPAPDPQTGVPKPAHIALAMSRLSLRESSAAASDGTTIKQVPLTGHPATLNAYCAKQALNLVRLALLT